MKTELSAKEKELYERVDEILYYLWDPLGVSNVPQARDEYHAYFPRVFGRLVEGYAPEKIAEYLTQIESDSMGLPQNYEKALEVANVLIETEEWMLE